MNTKFSPANRLPRISLSLVGGGSTLIDRVSLRGNWKIIIVYRGAHCPLCARYLKTLQELRGKFREDGVEILALSADTGPVAESFAHENSLTIPLAYGLGLQQMQQLGLYISDPIGTDSQDTPYPEPGLFVLNANTLVHVVTISNAPFVRPDLEALYRSLKYIRLPGTARHDDFGGSSYPIRGTHLS